MSNYDLCLFISYVLFSALIVFPIVITTTDIMYKRFSIKRYSLEAYKNRYMLVGILALYIITTLVTLG